MKGQGLSVKRNARLKVVGTLRFGIGEEPERRFSGADGCSVWCSTTVVHGKARQRRHARDSHGECCMMHALEDDGWGDAGGIPVL